MKKSILLTSIALMFVTISFAQTVDASYLNPTITSDSNYEYLRFGNPSDYKAGLLWNNTSQSYGNGDDFSIFTYNNRDLTFYTGTGNFIVFPSSGGNVGIGTQSPAAKLHVVGNGIRADRFSLSGISDLTNNSPWYGLGRGTFTDLSNDDTKGSVQLAGYYGLLLKTSAGSLGIHQNGNVGIGTTNPTEKLDVNGAIKSKSGIFEAADTQAAINSTDYRDWGKYSLALAAGKVLETQTNGYQARKLEFFDYPATDGGLPAGTSFSLKNDNNKVFFTTSSFNTETRFEVADPNGAEIIKAGNFSANSSNNATNESVNWVHLLKAKSRLAVGTWAMYKPEHEFTVRGSGWFEHEIITDSKIGIGVQASDIPANYKLAVAGKIISEEVKVELQNTWPDYVFANNYKLPTLLEVENHIKEKGHLQNIPSASEVSENGIQLGEMNAKLLEKIEELTLYTIAQEKQLQEQQEKNKNLETRLAKLEALLIKK
ncbi:hypothetical protein [uncultured Aquimarina sp.]|uniref:hypothetical protein n=1 Tax=uncultured Aquimarina sp. TaxID=575652 RepID=UPI002616FEDE|nr:hypothetical protein [uncultured Aquimarina sp.]